MTDAILDALYDLDGVTDPDLGAKLATGRVDIPVIVEADDFDQSVAKALAAIPTAIHVADGVTAGVSRRSARSVRAPAR
jgi:hypothetical protein